MTVSVVTTPFRTASLVTPVVSRTLAISAVLVSVVSWTKPAATSETPKRSIVAKAIIF
jgi:hypothetical protein